MKERKFILLACLIVLSIIGVGYSAWTEGLNINSFFTTGYLHISFQAPNIENIGSYEINADADDESVLEISGEVDPDFEVFVDYDICNNSSIPVRYHPDDDEGLPEGITLELSNSVIEPGESLHGTILIMEPGKNEIVLPFEQYNSSVRGGWREELKISWDIAVVKEIVNPELVIPTNDAIIVELPTGDVPPETNPVEDDSDSDSPVTESPTGTESPMTESPTDTNSPVTESPTDTDSKSPDPAENPITDNPITDNPTDNPITDTPVIETSPEDSELQTETDENLLEDNKGSDEGSEVYVDNGEE